MSESMKKRFLTLIFILPVGVFLIYSPLLNGLLVFGALIVVGILLALEISAMLQKKGMSFDPWTLSVFSTLSHINHILYSNGIYDIGYFFILWVALLLFYLGFTFFRMSITGSSKNTLETVSISLLVFLFTSLFLPLGGSLKVMSPNGWMLTFPLALAWLTDAGGLFIGKWLGKTPLNMLSSPHKTVEGYAGSMVFGLLTGLILFILQETLSPGTDFNLFQILIISLLLSLAANLGDLAESTFKRWAGVKDSSDLFPGHGGVYDMFDSVLFTLPLFYIIIKLMGY